MVMIGNSTVQVNTKSDKGKDNTFPFTALVIIQGRRQTVYARH